MRVLLAIYSVGNIIEGQCDGKKKTIFHDQKLNFFKP